VPPPHAKSASATSEIHFITQLYAAARTTVNARAI
jgi:hypothetical protein